MTQLVAEPPAGSTEQRGSKESIYPYKLKDGSTRYYVMYRTSNGVQKSKRGFQSRRTARAWRSQKVAAAARGELIASRDTFASYIARWLEERRPHLEPGTGDDYARHIRLRLIPFFGQMKLTAITAEDIRRYVSEQLNAGKLSAKTINNSLAVLGVALADAKADRLIVENPAVVTGSKRERIKLPAEHKEMDFLRIEEIPRYLDGCSDTYRPLAELLIATGLRISEALALTWADVDWRHRALRIVRSRKREGDGSPKGRRSRSVAFGPRIEQILRDLHARQSEQQAGELRASPIFIGPRGGRLNRSDISRDDHKDALENAGLRTSLRLHDLRHTAAASWLASDLPLIYVQRQLGHASITTTEQQYGHLEEEYLRDAPARAEQAVWEREPAVA